VDGPAPCGLGSGGSDRRGEMTASFFLSSTGARPRRQGHGGHGRDARCAEAGNREKKEVSLSFTLRSRGRGESVN